MKAGALSTWGGIPGQRVAVVVLGAAPSVAPDGVEWVVVPADPVVYAHRLYALLRALDDAGYDRIVLQQPPAEPAWQGVNDRIGRAAAAFEE